MTYDKDLKKWRLVFALMSLMNVGTGVLNAFDHRWMIVVACMVFAKCCLLLVGFAGSLQKTRDMSRLIEAGLHGMRQEIERGQ